jgi:CheY-like chemotaxis protein
MEGQSLRILVADDQPDGADSLAMLLRAVNHQVDVAYGGDEAFRLACAHPFDVVLLDIAMPKLDGFRLANQIREDSLCKHSLLIAITGFADENHRLQSHAVGFEHYLVKPIDPPVLVSLLQEWNAQKIK